MSNLSAKYATQRAKFLATASGTDDIFEVLENKHIKEPYLNDKNMAQASFITEFTDPDADIIFKAREYGDAGNDLTLVMKTPATYEVGNRTICYFGNDPDEVVISLRRDADGVVATANEVIAAVNANDTASALITAELYDGASGEGLVEVIDDGASQSFTGGVDGVKLIANAKDINNAVVPSLKSIELTQDGSAADYTVLAQDSLIVNTRSTAPNVGDIILPAATGSLKVYIIKNIGDDDAKVIPSGTGSIDGLGELTLSTLESATVIDASTDNWYVI